MKYKIGDWVIYTDKDYSNNWKKQYGISLYGKIAKIIHIERELDILYLLNFKEYINSFRKTKGKSGHCIWCKHFEIKFLDSLKFKKWIKG